MFFVRDIPERNSGDFFGAIPGMLNVSDDILVYAKFPEEHNNNLKQVLSQLREKGLLSTRGSVRSAKTT